MIKGKLSGNQRRNLSPRVMGLFLMIGCSVMISFGGLIYRSFQDIEILEIVFFRSLALITYMSVFLCFKFKFEVIKNVKKIGLRGIFASAVFCLAQVSWLTALKYTSVANATFTLCVTPFVTAIVAYFFIRESISRITFLTMFIAIIGVTIMVVGGLETTDNRGLLFAICTSVAFAVFAVILRANRNLDMLPVLLVTGIFMALIGWFGGSFSNAIPLSDIILCLLWGTVLQGFAHSLMIKATRLILSAEITLFMLLEFTLNPLWVWLFINEVPTLSTLLGGSIIILSVCVLAGNEMRYSFQTKRDPLNDI